MALYWWMGGSLRRNPLDSSPVLKLVMAAPQAKKWAVPTPKVSMEERPRSPDGPPPKRQRIEELHERVGEFSNEFCDCYTLFVNEDAQQPVDDESIEAYEVLPGRYWKIGVMHTYPVFRQELPADVTTTNNMQLFLHYKLGPDEGWYIATDMYHNTETKVYAYAKPLKEPHSLPIQYHVPFWRKTINWDVNAQSQHKYNDGFLSNLMLEKAEVEAEVAFLRPSLDGSQPLEPEVAAEDHGKGKKGHDERSITAGWMNKAANLLKLIQDEEWDALNALAEDYAALPNMQKLMQYRSKQVRGGKGSKGSKGSKGTKQSKGKGPGAQ